MVTPKTEQKRNARQPLHTFARAMRHKPTDAEKKFWSAVRGRRFGGYKFKRQYPIGPYIADFVCLERRLIVELDSGQHAVHQEHDAERTTHLETQGFHVLRYWNHEFLPDPEVILDEVLRALNAPSPGGR